MRSVSIEAERSSNLLGMPRCTIGPHGILAKLARRLSGKRIGLIFQQGSTFPDFKGQWGPGSVLGGPEAAPTDVRMTSVSRYNVCPLPTVDPSQHGPPGRPLAGHWPLKFSMAL